jgi:hypothetical protein
VFPSQEVKAKPNPIRHPQDAILKKKKCRMGKIKRPSGRLLRLHKIPENRQNAQFESEALLR